MKWRKENNLMFPDSQVILGWILEKVQRITQSRKKMVQVGVMITSIAITPPCRDSQ